MYEPPNLTDSPQTPIWHLDWDLSQSDETVIAIVMAVIIAILVGRFATRWYRGYQNSKRMGS